MSRLSKALHKNPPKEEKVITPVKPAPKEVKQAVIPPSQPPTPVAAKSPPHIDISKLDVLSLKSIIDDEDRRPEAIRYDPEYTHVSSILDACPRNLVLMYRMKQANSEKQAFSKSHTGGHKVMWKIGRAIEAHIRETLFKRLGYKNIYGVWKCDCGNIVEKGTCSDLHCPKCDSKNYNYFEYSIFNEEAKIVGNPDGLLIYKNKLLPLEIKSMNSKDFDKLEAPVPKHIQQVLFYRLLLLKNGMPAADQVRLIYCTKDFKFGSPYKEFIVDATKDPNRLFVEQMFNTSKEIYEHKQNGTLPERVICSSCDCTTAKNCNTLVECFSL